MLLGINSFNNKSFQKGKFYIDVYKSSVTALVRYVGRLMEED